LYELGITKLMLNSLPFSPNIVKEGVKFPSEGSLHVKENLRGQKQKKKKEM